MLMYADDVLLLDGRDRCESAVPITSPNALKEFCDLKHMTVNIQKLRYCLVDLRMMWAAHKLLIALCRPNHKLLFFATFRHTY